MQMPPRGRQRPEQRAAQRRKEMHVVVVLIDGQLHHSPSRVGGFEIIL